MDRARRRPRVDRVYEHRRGRPLPLFEQEGEALGLLEQWEGAAAAVLVDAIHSGAPAGTIHRVDASAEPIPASLASSSSTHAVGVGEAVELARALGRLPRQTVVYGVEGGSFEVGDELTPAVAAAVERVAEAVREEVVECMRRR